MILRTLAFVAGLYCCISVEAQSIHFSNYEHASHSLSPALIGAYSGSLKVGMNLREQYRAFIGNPFQTATAFVDAPIAAGLPENQWLGIGLELSNTQAGDLSLQRTGSRLGIAYHRSSGKKHKKIMGVGFQLSMVNNQIRNRDAAKFEDEILGLTQSLDQSLLENQNSTKLFLNAGAYFKKQFNKKTSFHGGVSLQNFSATNEPLPLTLGIYGEWTIKRSKKISLNPSFLIQTHSRLYNTVGSIGIRDNNFLNKNIAIEYRLGYRLNDAIIAGLIVDVGQWSAGIHYDLTVSSARNYNGLNGALQIGVSRTFIIYPKVKKKLLDICPRL